jgi:hypothetical protein
MKFRSRRTACPTRTASCRRGDRLAGRGSRYLTRVEVNRCRSSGHGGVGRRRPLHHQQSIRLRPSDRGGFSHLPDRPAVALRASPRISRIDPGRGWPPLRLAAGVPGPRLTAGRPRLRHPERPTGAAAQEIRLVRSSTTTLTSRTAQPVSQHLQGHTRAGHRSARIGHMSSIARPCNDLRTAGHGPETSDQISARRWHRSPPVVSDVRRLLAPPGRLWIHPGPDFTRNRGARRGVSGTFQARMPCISGVRMATVYFAWSTGI